MGEGRVVASHAAGLCSTVSAAKKQKIIRLLFLCVLLFFFFCEEAGVVHFCIKQAVIVYVVGEVWWQDNGRVYEYVG